MKGNLLKQTFSAFKTDVEIATNSFFHTSKNSLLKFFLMQWQLKLLSLIRVA
jgi:hypothetical protein